MKLSTRSRVAIDTNVFISGIVFGGKPEKLITMVKDRRFRLVMSVFLASEIHNILLKFPVNKSELSLADKLVNQFSLKFKTPPVVNICRDLKDNQILDLCLFSKADYLVTGDKDLLTIGEFMTTKILTTTEFLSIC